MKHTLSLLEMFLLLINFASGQSFNKSINKDSLMQNILKQLPEEKRDEFSKHYKEGNDEAKEFLLFMLSMPRSSRNELKANIDSNFEKISLLRKSFPTLIPKGYVVSIEFNPPNNLMMTKESVDMMIKDTTSKESKVKQEWNMEFNSEKLEQMLKRINWTNETLMNVKKLLADAKCISIKNGNTCTLGFARSGMGKYSFVLFKNDLTPDEIKEYNDGCTYIFYKNNIVLEYGGGAVGPQCFTDVD